MKTQVLIGDDTLQLDLTLLLAVTQKFVRTTYKPIPRTSSINF